MSDDESVSEPTELESVLITAMMELADALIGDFDIVDMTALLAERCVALLNVDAAGLEPDPLSRTPVLRR